MQIKLTPRQVRNLMVASITSLVLALPLLSQPLGLSSAWNDESAGSNIESPAFGETTVTVEAAAGLVLLPLESADLGVPLYNRGQSDSLETNEGTADAAEDPESGYDEVLPEDLDPVVKPQESGSTPDSESSLYKVIPVDYTLYIKANNLNLRSLPTTSSDVVTELKFGDKVRAIGENDEWMKVTFDGKTGYLKAEYTSKSMVFESVKEIVYIDAGKVNLRQGPSTQDDIIVKLERNAKLTRTGVGEGWSKVKMADGKTGYVASDFLTKNAPASTRQRSSGSISSSSGSSSVGGKAGQAVDLAYKALGVRYRFGSASLSGMDCSGLTYWIYRQLGISVPRTSSGFAGAGKSVSHSDIQAGDIIAMDTRTGDGRRSITHVGIYIGNGNMIHASSRLGHVVIRNVNDYLSGGVRIITIRRFINS